MKSFFEMSYEEWCEQFKCLQNEASRAVWNAGAVVRFKAIKASDHYHNGVPCREFHNLPSGQEMQS